MLTYIKRSGEKGRFGCHPGCLIASIVLSIGLTVLLNLILWLFSQ